jgi:Zn-dependent protease with chaperone function
VRGRLFFASAATIGILVCLVFVVVLLASFAAGLISGAAMIILTVVISVVSWLVSPWFTDLIHRWVYKFRVMEFDELAKRSPGTAQFLTEACRRHNIKVPMLRILDDMNPTAYCYGSLPSNSRIVVSEGLFRYLSQDELTAVYGHELGHIRNLDFIVMTVANTLLMILYEIYVIFTRIRSRGKNNPLPLIGLISLVFWWIGTYLVLYLSRTREYLADHFAGVETGNPNALATALVKIGYGIAAEPDTALSARLMGSTRALNIVDYKGVDAVSTAVNLSADPGGPADGKVPSFDARRVSRVFLFDIYNPWAFIVQLGSTHPLTGKRIMALMGLAAEKNQSPVFNFNEIGIDGADLDRTRLYGRFFFEVLVYFAPIIGIAVGLLPALADHRMIGVVVLAFGLGLLTKGIYRFPSIKNPEEATVLDLMSDPYASPLRGKPVIVSGTAIGKASAGSLFGEDLVVHDPSGGLITLNYESIVPFFGNLFFGYARARDIIGRRVTATGWFRRKVYQLIDAKTIETPERPFASYTRFRALLLAVIVTGLGIAATIMSLAAAAAPGGLGGQGAH